MNTIGFWTATVAEKNILTRDTPSMVPERTMQTRVDDYFFIAGKKAYVLFHTSGVRFPDTNPESLPIKFEHHAVLLPTNSPLWLTVLKIISYCTVIIPLIMLGLKIYCRCVGTFDKIAKKRIGIEYIEKTPEEAGVKVSVDSKSGVTTIFTAPNLQEI